MPTYGAILTTLGAQRLAEAAVSDALVFVEIAVGDGGGLPITPAVGMTALVNETARVTVNTVNIAPTEPNTVRVEAVIPAATGGFYIREAGIFNGDGELIAIASYPPIYKPTPGEGASVDEYIRILITYSPVSAISLTVDPAVVLATRLYVDDAVAAAGTLRIVPILFTGTTSDGETITTGSRVYEFDTNGSVGAGHVPVDISGGASGQQSAAALLLALLGDADALFVAPFSFGAYIPLVQRLDNHPYGPPSVPSVSTTCAHITIGSVNCAAPVARRHAGGSYPVTGLDVTAMAQGGGTGAVAIGAVATNNEPRLESLLLYGSNGKLKSVVGILPSWTTGGNGLIDPIDYVLQVNDSAGTVIASGDTLAWTASFEAA